MMLRFLNTALFFLIISFSSVVLSKGYEDEFDTLWESLWSQGGSPQEVVRWPLG
jgi:hypothetical protein